MDLDGIRNRLPHELARRVDLDAAWRRYRDDDGRDDIDGFLVWLANEHPGQFDPMLTLAAVPVEVSLLLPTRFAPHPAQAPAATTPSATVQAHPGVPREGDDFPYVLLGNAGRGGMGTVHIARDVELARRVALKELNDDLRDVEGIRARFIREAQITAQLDHPNVVPVYALELTPGGMPAYTMKFVQGRTFGDLIDETRAACETGKRPDDAHSLATRLEHFLKVADAISYAHDKGVIHRDLKPANLMLGRHHEVYVMDWGLCRLLHQTGDEPAPSPDSSRVISRADLSGSASETRAGDIIGTPRYMSPEQANGFHEATDARSDQYALGLILYELVTLGAPYEGSSAYDVLMNARAARRRPVEPSYRSMRIPRELAAVIERATQSEPERRYPNVTALADDLRRFLRGDAVETAPDTPWQRLQRGMVRHRQRVLTGILALIAVSGCAIGALLWHNQRVLAAERVHERHLLELRNSVARGGDRIQTRLLQLEGALVDLATSAEEIVQHGAPGTARVYLLDDFTDPARVPPDLVPAPVFGGRISLGWPVWMTGPDLDEAEARARIRRLAPLQESFARLYRRIQRVVRGDARGFYTSAPQAPVDNTGHAIVMGIVLGLADGLAALYPGWTEVLDHYDPRDTKWYHYAEGRDGPQWGIPAPDIEGGPVVIPLSIALYDHQRHLLGALALLLVPQQFLHDLLELGGVDGMHEVLLADDQGRVLAVAEDGRDTDPDDADGALARKILAGIGSDGTNVREMNLSGAPRTVVVDHIDPLGWTLMAVAESDSNAAD
ncbi:MAG TPA: serine/threonine protein kinase [Rhodanobacteraceae bacterium]|nr:serine/threonine protein kinase [Rhodanobacteraceae bacterium]